MKIPAQPFLDWDFRALWRKAEGEGGMQKAEEAKGAEGWHGWDDYAPFYDWENRRTVGRRDVPFWTQMARQVNGPVLELGCGTGRVSLPVARAGVRLIGIDRSARMLAIARRRLARARLPVTLLRGDIRALPFASGQFQLVMAPYGVIQSLVHEADLAAALSAVAGATAAGGLFVLDLVPELPDWQEYRKRLRLRGWRPGRASHLTLIESVRQDRRRKLTIFEQQYVERRGSTRKRRTFTLAFRTLSVPQLRRRLERAGFEVAAVIGDYNGRPWDPRAEVWVIVARKR